jgi:predicted dehydrogenase
MKVGLIGFGMVAQRFHAPLISVEPKLHLTYVVERTHNRSQELYPKVTVLRTAQELFQTDVEVVVVLTPNESHFPLALEALAAGKHVVLEKPMTINSAQADELIQASRLHQKMLTVFHNRRWDGDFLTLRGLLENKTLGEVVSLESHFDRFRPNLKGGWRENDAPGSGVLYDLGSHLLDQCFQLFGLPQALLADLRIERTKARITDAFTIFLDYGTVRAELKASCLAAEPKLRFKVRGTQGTWMRYGLDPQEDALREGQLPEGDDWGKVAPQHWGTLFLEEQGIEPNESSGKPFPEEAGCYPRFYSELAAALENNGDPPVSPEEARNVIRAVELCQESHRQRQWVQWY